MPTITGQKRGVIEVMNNNNNNNNDEETCGICLDEIPENNTSVTTCGHLFCYDCIKQVLSVKSECPYCRKKLNKNDIFMISYEKKNKQLFLTLLRKINNIVK